MMILCLTSLKSRLSTCADLGLPEPMRSHGELPAEVEKGEQSVITRRGEAIARLVAAVPATPKRSSAQQQRQRVAEALDELKRLRAGTTLDLPLRQAIELGRD